MKGLTVLLLLFFTFHIQAEELTDLLNGIKEKYKLPSVAAAVSKDGKIIAKAAIGIRKVGSSETVTIEDKYHIGSCTKSMTATVAAILVEEGKIKWASTLEEIFPDLKEDFHKSYLKVSLEQLLSMTGGVPNIFEKYPKLWQKIYENKKVLNPVQQRNFLLKEVLKREPSFEAGTDYIYSNSSFAIAGIMLEKVSGKTWEELIIQLLAKPLKMKSLGYGAPAKDKSKVDQPYGHIFNGEKNTPIFPGYFDDNPAAIAPAGLVHLSIVDFAKYSAFYADKCKGLLNESSFIKLTKPVKESYALGWAVFQRSWGGTVLHHSGSNTINYAIMWISPSKKFSLVVTTNTAGPKVAEALDKIAGKIINKYID
ncbi:MAG: beta-lactamase family protein [Lentisphaeraceae bacterium]|nr:beta-lactamase family protein [Lentisphaeraceae bacterium]